MATPALPRHPPPATCSPPPPGTSYLRARRIIVDFVGRRPGDGEGEGEGEGDDFSDVDSCSPPPPGTCSPPPPGTSYLRARHIIVDFVGRRPGDGEGRRSVEDEAAPQALDLDQNYRLEIPLVDGRSVWLQTRGIRVDISQYIEESSRTKTPLSPTFPLPPVQMMQPASPDDHTPPQGSSTTFD